MATEHLQTPLEGWEEAYRATPERDAPFTTPFGNRSTPRNYLRTMLLEEHHHRAQMTMAMRLAEIERPPYPGQAWLELGVDQG